MVKAYEKNYIFVDQIQIAYIFTYCKSFNDYSFLEKLCALYMHIYTVIYLIVLWKIFFYRLEALISLNQTFVILNSFKKDRSLALPRLTQIIKSLRLTKNTTFSAMIIWIHHFLSHSLHVIDYGSVWIDDIVQIEIA